LVQCSALVAIADHGGFTRAASALGISQSAISHAIASLEIELGSTLMERDRLGVRFTESGREVLGHARVMVSHAEQIRRIVDGSYAGVLPTMIRFATSESFAVRLLPMLVTRFRALLPGQELELRIGSDGQITQWLQCQAVDVGVVTLPKDDLNTVLLGHDEIRLLLPAGHRLASRGTVPLRELADETLLIPGGTMASVVRLSLRIIEFVPGSVLRTPDLRSLLAMVAQGYGLAILPESTIEPDLPGIVQVSLAPSARRPVALGVRTGVRSPSPVSVFIGVARGLVGKMA
jgi:DNA-binding transcriptional LysR family regulator